MISFKEYYNLLFENVVNLIGSDSIQKRVQYADQVWNILQTAYQSIGGIKGSGFNSKEEMIQKIPFWKLYIQNGKVMVVVMYKDKNGRKIVALATDGSSKGKEILKKIAAESYKVGWGEYSKAALVFLMKTIPFDVLEPYILHPSQVQKLLPKYQIIPIVDYLNSGKSLEDSDIKIYKKYSNLLPYFYVREIGGVPSLKVAIGTPGKQIV